MRKATKKKKQFSDEDQVVLFVRDSRDVAYLVAAGVEQHADFTARSIPVEVGPRRVVGLRMRVDDVLDLADTLHKHACPVCSEGRGEFERARAVDSLRAAIDVCWKYAQEHPEHGGAAAQIAVRIAKLGRPPSP
jgi:hypothetical protein